MDHHKTMIVDRVAELLESGYRADLTIRCCDGTELKVHRVIVCRCSSVMAAACDGHFEEAHTGVVEAEEFDSDTVRRMLAYMYAGDYDDGRLGDSGPGGAIVKNKCQAATDAVGPEGVAGTITSLHHVNSALTYSAVDTAPATAGLTFPSLFGPNSGTDSPPQVLGVHEPSTADDTENVDDASIHNGGSADFSLPRRPVDDAPNAPASPTATGSTAPAPPADDFTAALVANVHTYVIGDYYDVPPLKELALAKLTARVSRGWPAAALAHVLELVARLTRLDGDALHDLVVAAAVQNAPRLVRQPAFRQLLVAGGTFAASLFERLVARHTLDVAALQQQMHNLKALFDGDPACHSCHTPFHIRIDLAANYIRCRVCDTLNSVS